MRTYDITINYHNKPELRKPSHSSPIRRLTTPWLESDLAFLRVYATVIGPETEEPERNFTLGRRESESVLKAIADIIKLLEEESR